MKIAHAALVLVLIATGVASCSKRQIAPVAVAGSGAALMTGGFVYRATIPEEDSGELFGEQPHQQATTAALIFSGAALVLTGVIWSIVTPLCETDSDCFGSDMCETGTFTCVPRPAGSAPEAP